MKALSFFSPLSKHRKGIPSSQSLLVLPDRPGLAPRHFTSFVGSQLSQVTLPAGTFTLTVDMPMSLSVQHQPVLYVANPTGYELALLTATLHSTVRLQNVDRNTLRVTKRFANHIIHLQPVLRATPESEWQPIGDTVPLDTSDSTAVTTRPHSTADGQALIVISGTKTYAVPSYILNSTHAQWTSALSQPDLIDPTKTLTALVVVNGITEWEMSASSNTNPSASVSQKVIYASHQVDKTWSFGQGPRPIVVGETVRPYDAAEAITW